MKIQDMTNEELCALTVAILDDNGHEILNPKPTVERLPGMKPDLETRIKNILAMEVRRRDAYQEMMAPETDPDDYNVDDEEPMPQSEYEIMQDEIPRGTDAASSSLQTQTDTGPEAPADPEAGGIAEGDSPPASPEGDPAPTGKP